MMLSRFVALPVSLILKASLLQYDHRHRPWYKQALRAWVADGTVTSWSSIYTFSTSQALGLSAMEVAKTSGGDLLGYDSLYN